MDYRTISKIFSDFLADTDTSSKFEQKLEGLLRLSIETNYKLWNLEDSARMVDLGTDHIAKVKHEIDKANQIRNNLIREIDTEIVRLFQVNLPNSTGEFYSESPGMIIDRLSILFIKLSVVKKLVSVIEEEYLRQDYANKKKIISGQIANIGHFLDSYFVKLKDRKVFFEIRQPVKIYNDKRIKKYIKILKQRKNLTDVHT